MRISDELSHVCPSDLFAALPDANPVHRHPFRIAQVVDPADPSAFRQPAADREVQDQVERPVERRRRVARSRRGPVARDLRRIDAAVDRPVDPPLAPRSEEHTSELQSLMRISYAVFCLKKTKTINNLQVTLP